MSACGSFFILASHNWKVYDCLLYTHSLNEYDSFIFWLEPFLIIFLKSQDDCLFNALHISSVSYIYYEVLFLPRGISSKEFSSRLIWKIWKLYLSYDLNGFQKFAWWAARRSIIQNERRTFWTKCFIFAGKQAYISGNN